MNDESDKCQCSMGVLPVSAVEGRAAAGCAVATLLLVTADIPLQIDNKITMNTQLNTTFRHCPWKQVLLYLCHHH